MKNLIIQALKFFCVSGIGWLLDFSVYALLTYALHFNVMLANIISSIPAITYVFLVSTRKIFKNLPETKVALPWKYLIYLVYQIGLVLGVSWVGQLLYDGLIGWVSGFNTPFFAKNFKIIIKILITPFTMVMNFIVMKLLVEKI